MTKQSKTYIKDLSDCIDQEVTISGWLYRGRPSGKLIFLVLRDGTGLCQCIVEKGSVSDDLFGELKRLGQESSLAVTGMVRAEPRSPGGVELSTTGVKIIGQSSDYPITPKSHGTDFLFKNRHLHLRSQSTWAIAKIRHTIIDAIRTFFNDNGFTLIDTPILTSAAGEDSSEQFSVDYFGDQLKLTQTGQLHVETAAMAHGKVYCFGPTFRAEKSKTRRHLTEFWMVEPEVAFIDLDELLELAENFTCSIARAVLDRNRQHLELLGADISHLENIQAPFYRLTYSEVVDILTSDKTRDFMGQQLSDLNELKTKIEKEIKNLQAQQTNQMKQWKKDKIAGDLIELNNQLNETLVKIQNNPKHAASATNFVWGHDLGGSDETIISLMHDRPIFVTHYPKNVKAFYMKIDRSNEKVVENFDMLAPAGFGEIIGGSIREDNYDTLLQKTLDQGLDPADYSWYLDLRKYGTVPHGGFGLGVERTVAWITGEKHIRQCIAFPRMPDKVYI